jgi:hypothetical protein
MAADGPTADFAARCDIVFGAPGTFATMRDPARPARGRAAAVVGGPAIMREQLDKLAGLAT